MSGFKVNFSVANQLATPSIHAAPFAQRPAAGQPGRLFVDTNNPSTGIYRDTGTVWENITGGAGSSNLQTVTDAGNTTDNNILLTYPDNTLANALVFYNDALSQEEYLIEKRGTGITTNDSLAIQSRGNISPSTNPVGFLIDGANDVIKTFYTTSFTDIGLKLDFTNDVYVLGDYNGVSNNTYITVDNANAFISLLCSGYGVSQQFDGINGNIEIASQNIIKTTNNGNDIGLKLDFANSLYSFGSSDVQSVIDINNGFYNIFFNTNQSGFRIEGVGLAYIGDVDNVANGTYLSIFDSNERIQTYNQGNSIGLKLDFANLKYYFGDYNSINNGVYFLADNDNGFADIYQQGYFSFRADGGDVRIGDLSGTSNFTYFGVNDTNEELIGSTGLLSNTASGTSGQHLKIRIGATLYKIKLENP